MKKEYITPYVTTVFCLVEHPILTASLPVGKDNGGAEQWSGRYEGNTNDEWDEE